MRQAALRGILLTLPLLGFAPSAPAVSVDERQPGYQAYIQALSDAQRGVLNAISALERAKGAHEVRGIDLDAMLTELRSMEQTLRLVTTPERKRMEFQTLVPDGAYFISPTPPTSQRDTN